VTNPEDPLAKPHTALQGPEQRGTEPRALELQDHDVDPLVRERILRRATAVLRQEQRRLAQRRWAWASLWYHRALEPALLIGLGASYLAWAVSGTLALVH
jgi:hypothetical protein